jgi:hypothetical protein
VSYFKKLVPLALLFGLFSTTLGTTESDAATVRRGKISHYDGIGAIAEKNHVLTKWDCAVGYNYRTLIPSGTPIYTSNEDKAKFVTLYKWDWGNFFDPVILDVMTTVYQNELGGSISAGYIPNGRISY